MNTKQSNIAELKYESPALTPNEANQLLNAICDVDVLLVDAEANYDFAKVHIHGAQRDALYEQYRRYRTILLSHRRNLQTLYTKLTDEAPWEEIPF